MLEELLKGLNDIVKGGPGSGPQPGGGSNKDEAGAKSSGGIKESRTLMFDVDN